MWVGGDRLNVSKPRHLQDPLLQPKKRIFNKSPTKCCCRPIKPLSVQCFLVLFCGLENLEGSVAHDGPKMEGNGYDACSKLNKFRAPTIQYLTLYTHCSGKPKSVSDSSACIYIVIWRVDTLGGRTTQFSKKTWPVKWGIISASRGTNLKPPPSQHDEKTRTWIKSLGMGKIIGCPYFCGPFAYIYSSSWSKSFGNPGQRCWLKQRNLQLLCD